MYRGSTVALWKRTEVQIEEAQQTRSVASVGCRERHSSLQTVQLATSELEKIMGIEKFMSTAKCILEL